MKYDEHLRLARSNSEEHAEEEIKKDINGKYLNKPIEDFQ